VGGWRWGLGLGLGHGRGLERMRLGKMRCVVVAADCTCQAGRLADSPDEAPTARLTPPHPTPSAPTHLIDLVQRRIKRVGVALGGGQQRRLRQPGPQVVHQALDRHLEGARDDVIGGDEGDESRGEGAGGL